MSAARWKALDRSDWPEIQSPDFVGEMQAVCPGCGLYRENDDSPGEHFDGDDLPGGGRCPWMTAHCLDCHGAGYVETSRGPVECDCTADGPGERSA